MSLCLQVWAWTGKGAVRSHNEDCVLMGDVLLNSDELGQYFDCFPLDQPLVIGVFDGMGGHRGGAVASKTVAEMIRDRSIDLIAQSQANYESTSTGIPRTISGWLGSAHSMLVARAAMDPSLGGMGCTASLLVVTSSKVTGANVGDSPIYQNRRGYLNELSEAHITLYPNGGRALTQAIGGTTDPTPPDPHIFELNAKDGLCFLLCSDGLTDEVELDRIEELMQLPPETAGKSLYQSAVAGGGRDNISIVIAKVSESQTPESTL